MMKTFKVKIFNEAHKMRESSVEAWNIDEAIEKAFSLCNKGEVAFVTRELSTPQPEATEYKPFSEQFKKCAKNGNYDNGLCVKHNSACCSTVCLNERNPTKQSEPEGAEEFYRKKLIELSKEGVGRRIAEVVNIDREVQICEEYHQSKLSKPKDANKKYIYQTRDELFDTIHELESKLANVKKGLRKKRKHIKYANTIEARIARSIYSELLKTL